MAAMTGSNSSGSADDVFGGLGLTEMLVLVVFGLPVAMSMALAWFKDLRTMVTAWLTERQLLSKPAPLVEIPGFAGYGPTFIGMVTLLGFLAVMIGAFGLMITSSRRGRSDSG